MKRLFRLLLLVMILPVCLLSFSACESYAEERLSNKFNEHLKNYYVTTKSETFQSEHLEFRKPQVEIEDVDYGTYHIVVSMGNWSNPSDMVWSLSVSDFKREMNRFAEVFIDFAKAENIDNDYYLYIEYRDGMTTSFVYDYEEDVLYLPKNYVMYSEMYDLFGSANPYKVADTEEGISWLIQHGFGEMKHKQFERIYDYSYPMVQINDDGEFHSYNLDWPYEK